MFIKFHPVKIESFKRSKDLRKDILGVFLFVIVGFSRLAEQSRQIGGLRQAEKQDRLAVALHGKQNGAHAVLFHSFQGGIEGVAGIQIKKQVAHGDVSFGVRRRRLGNCAASRQDSWVTKFQTGNRGQGKPDERDRAFSLFLTNS